jgi:hypothetical protein
MGASFPIAIFATLLMTVIISVAFVARFHPNIGRFSGIGAGFSAVAITALFSYHHYFPTENAVAQDPASTANANSTDSAAPTAAAAVGNAPAPAASNTSTLAQGAAPAAPVTAAASSQSLPAQGLTPAQGQTQPLAQGQVQGQAQGSANLAQQTNPTVPSAVNDTIPPIPGHADSLSGSGSLGRAPAAVDRSSKEIIDPLAHEEFFSAIKMGNLEVVKSLIDRKQVDPDFTLDKGSTPLIAASASGRLKVVEYLLRRRVNINAQDPHGTTALMWAVFKGHRDVAKLLISKGADTKVIRDDGDTALDIARKWKQNEIASLLKEAANQDEDKFNRKSSSSSRRKRRH